MRGQVKKFAQTLWYGASSTSAPLGEGATFAKPSTPDTGFPQTSQFGIIMHIWAVQDAKVRFSGLLDTCLCTGSGPKGCHRQRGRLQGMGGAGFQAVFLYSDIYGKVMTVNASSI